MSEYDEEPSGPVPPSDRLVIAIIVIVIGLAICAVAYAGLK